MINQLSSENINNRELGEPEMPSFDLPKNEDLKDIENILNQWTDGEEVEKYLKRIKDQINGRTEYGMNFWTMKEANKIIGVGGLADPLPSILKYASTKNPGELKILYLYEQARGKSFGKKFLLWLEEKAFSQGRNELLVRSAEQYRDTAFEFYKKNGYEDLGQIINEAGKPMQLFKKILDKTEN